jgi:phosphoribosylamine--glycine ligase
MNVLLIGSGAREHAIAWKLRKSPLLSKLYTAPGNPGTGVLGENVAVSVSDLDGLVRLAKECQIDVTIVGPEGPLADGICDLFDSQKLPIFGPTRAAARIESSKAFSKELMLRNGIPTPAAKIFDSYEPAKQYVLKQSNHLVIKADGLAAGKGVIVCENQDEALEALRQCFLERAFGSAGDRVLVEDRFEGPEVSVFGFTDGKTISSLVAACDYKRIGDEDSGPNTGGMGSYSPPHFWDYSLEQKIRERIMTPTVTALMQEGCPYEGILYAGVMLTSEGPKVLEFNARFGDPETQVILPRLRTDLLEVVLAITKGTLDQIDVEWTNDSCVGVVMSSKGYPGNYPTGLPITGLSDLDADVLAFHAGTKSTGISNLEMNQLKTDGGRVLTLAALGSNLTEARERIYSNIERVRFEGNYYRRDIADVR